MAENPKAAFGNAKLNLSTVPVISTLYLAAAHDLGATKYGAFNWRENPVRAKDYVASMKRHLSQWESGEDIDDESGLPHLACLMTGASLILDAAHNGTMIDDREVTDGYPAALRAIAEMKKGWIAAKAERDAALAVA